VVPHRHRSRAACLVWASRLAEWPEGWRGTHHWLFIVGAIILAVVLFCWFAKVIEENEAGLANAQLKRSYVWE